MQFQLEIEEPQPQLVVRLRCPEQRQSCTVGSRTKTGVCMARTAGREAISLITNICVLVGMWFRHASVQADLHHATSHKIVFLNSIRCAQPTKSRKSSPRNCTENMHGPQLQKFYADLVDSMPIVATALP